MKIIFVGDLCPIRRVEKLTLNGRAEAVFGDTLPELYDKDLSVANLECPLTERNSPITKSGPNLKAHPKTVDCLKAGGFDIANLANNHILDYGCDAVDETIQLLKANNIKSVGAGSNLSTAQKPLRVKVGKKTIMFLGFAQNEFNCAYEMNAGAWPLDPITNISKIRKAKDESDIVIVLVHGGNEYNPVPSPRIVNTYRAYIDAGASAVVGAHPHVPQGYEIYNNAPIFYSLGNFIFDSTQEKKESPFWSKSFFVRLHFQENKVNNIEIVPYKALPENACLLQLKGEELDEFKRYITSLSEILKDEDKIRNYWNAWCALKGPAFLRWLSVTFPITLLYTFIPWKNPDKNRFLLSARYLMKCEAHQELLSSFLDLVMTKQIEKAKEHIPALKALQKGIN
ncbi:MAG: CapA family protein [Candidatus Bathyarchaeota archaeon]